MRPFNDKSNKKDLNIIEEIMVDYLQFHGEKDQKWHDTVAALQSINNKDVMDSDKVNQWLKKSGASAETVDFIKFNKPPPEPAIYKKMDKKLLESTDDSWIYQQVADHISNLFHNKEDFIFGVEKVLGAPQSIKNIHYLWLFSSEVGGNGLNGFIFNGCSSDLEWLLTLKALRAINATEILQRVESAIVLALQDDFILEEHDLSNFNDLEIYSQFDTVEKIDEDIYELASSPFDKMVADYIRKHKNDIFE